MTADPGSHDAATQTPDQQQPPTEEVVKNHPLYKALEEKHAAETKMWKGRVEASKEAKSEKKDDEKYVTQEALDMAKWELQKGKEIALAPEEYAQYREKGFVPAVALKLAHFDKGILPSAIQEHVRQMESSHGGSSVNRSTEEEVPEHIQEEMRKWGFSKETYLKHKDSVAQMMGRKR